MTHLAKPVKTQWVDVVQVSCVRHSGIPGWVSSLAVCKEDLKSIIKDKLYVLSPRLHRMPEPTHSPEVWGLWHVQTPPFSSQNSQGTNCRTASFRLEINPPILAHHTARASLLHEHSCFLGQFNTQARSGTVLKVFLTLKSADCFKSKE